jgi:Rps23 Pro-64 3,4-dihydroxylase Tpa1-like proline 4-hydroxylase
MAKKIANPEKLKAEIALQQSKIESLKLLDGELSKKVERLNYQRKQVHEKIRKLNHACQQNIIRLQSIQGN